ncbi:MAG: prepilin-type N-terminal cleavage/methylation domain-containing protein [Candidatus Wallbacteria bacterium]
MFLFNSSKRVNSKKGFTLTEIMIVLVVLGLLIAVALPKVTQVLSTGKTNATKTSLSSIAKAMKNFNADTSIWPGDINDLFERPVETKKGYHSTKLTPANYTAVQIKNWKGPYMDGTTNEISVDAWGAKISVGVVDPASGYKGTKLNETFQSSVSIDMTNLNNCESFKDGGAVSGLYLQSCGEDTATGAGSGTDSLVKDDIFTIVTAK